MRPRGVFPSNQPHQADEEFAVTGPSGADALAYNSEASDSPGCANGAALLSRES